MERRSGGTEEAGFQEEEGPGLITSGQIRKPCCGS